MGERVCAGASANGLGASSLRRAPGGSMNSTESCCAEGGVEPFVTLALLFFLFS